MSLQTKTLHQLRSIAQGYGIGDIFAKTETQLRQEIELKQVEQLPKPEIVIPQPEYDARLMTRPPAKRSDKDLIQEGLKEYIARGLRLTFPDEETWQMQYSKKIDTGTIRMPLRHVLNCAAKLIA